MASETHAPGYVPNPNYTQEDWDDVHSPELTDEQLAGGRPAVEVWPELVEAVRKRRGPQKAPTKAQLTLRVDREVIEAYRASGAGWQVRMNEALRKGAGL
ncbi:BrnA antitoxin family protein [Lichenihabitans sp. Uapishka_5]|uniref:BrnA antitoxin family protein n=1 Tax=Lichenihabitans sp. Uapishka_5 TaxID=3037302 RepID=UPI0029E7D37E|nr:BrnA antitoxin family protein [Lichenihabitans sp. Uapishka_5]MDX7952147.1 BrnA antitoxin family protein [Lichenihabitans sp. Uapishka_5]